MDTEQLRIQVAEARGYRWMRWHDIEYISPFGEPVEAILCHPSEKWLEEPRYVEDSTWSNRRICDNVPHYSTDMDAVWELIEEIREAGYRIEFYTGNELVRITIHGAFLTRIERYCNKNENTDAIVICLAYLDWKRQHESRIT